MSWHRDPSISGMRVPVDRVSCPDTEMTPGPWELAFRKNLDLRVRTWNPVHRGFARIRTPCGPGFMSWHGDPSYITISVSGCRFGRKKNSPNSTSTHSNCTMNSTWFFTHSSWVLPGGTNFFWLPSPPRINLEEPISSDYLAHLGLTWRNQFLLVTQPI